MNSRYSVTVGLWGLSGKSSPYGTAAGPSRSLDKQGIDTSARGWNWCLNGKSSVYNTATGASCSLDKQGIDTSVRGWNKVSMVSPPCTIQPQVPVVPWTNKALTRQHEDETDVSMGSPHRTIQLQVVVVSWTITDTSAWEWTGVQVTRHGRVVPESLKLGSQ